jgi:hypothetical protein
MRFPARLALFFTLALPLISKPSRAEVGVYGMASGSFLGSTGTLYPGQTYVEGGSFGAPGGTFGIYGNILTLGPIRLGADARYFFSSSSNQTGIVRNKLSGSLGGLRVAFKVPIVPLKPYVQGEVGAIITNYGFTGNQTSRLAYQVQGGVDYTVIPHFDLRAEYGAGQADGVYRKQALQEVGLGLVFRF